MPELISRKGVELVKVGNWPAVTGPADITQEKIDSMVEASKADWWNAAAMKIGHYDPRFALTKDGEPALGWVENLEATVNDKGELVLIGDLERMTSQNAELLVSAYRNRSIEWEEDYVAPDGKTYPAVLRGLAILGANQPGVEGLADVYELFAASSNVTPENVYAAFVGDSAEEIVGHLSALSDIIHTQDKKIVHDTNQLRQTDTEIELSSQSQGEAHMTDTLDSRLREMLQMPDDGDLEAEIQKLVADKKVELTKDDEAEVVKTETGAAAPSQPVVANATDNEDLKAEKEGMISVSQAYLDDLAAKANAGAVAAQKIQEQEIDAELKAAAKAGVIVPAEFDTLKAQMLEGEVQAQTVRKSLSVRPKMLSTAQIGSAEDLSPQSEDEIYASIASRIGIPSMGVKN